MFLSCRRVCVTLSYVKIYSTKRMLLDEERDEERHSRAHERKYLEIALVLIVTGVEQPEAA